MGRKSKKSNLRKNEILCNKKPVDLKRFAYDVIKYSALKFRVPDNCIRMWEGVKNDDPYRDFVSVISRSIIKKQISMRLYVHDRCIKAFESNELQTFKKVCDLFQDIIRILTSKNWLGYEMNIVSEFETTLAIACELVLFFNSKNSALYLNELADYWFECFVTIRKDRFVKAEGFDIMYLNGMHIGDIDEFFNYFIPEHCYPYEASLTHQDLGSLFQSKYLSYQNDPEILKEWKKKNERVHDPQDLRENKELFANYKLIKSVPIFEPKIAYLPIQDPELEGATGTDDLKNTGLGIRPHEELLREYGALAADITPFQDIPEISPLEHAKQSRRSYLRGRKQKPRSRLYSDGKQGLGQSILESSRTLSVKKPSALVSDYPSQSQEYQGVRPKEPIKHRRGLSGQQSKPETESSLVSSIEQGLEQLSLNPSGTKQSDDKKQSVSEEDDQTAS